jgi:FKBP-type peptidyl-prolyl cis-trans isomerase
MNRRSLTTFALRGLIGTAVNVAAGQSPTTAPADAETDAATATTQPAAGDQYLSDASYGIGFDMGRQLSQAPFKLDVERFVEGLRDSLAGKESGVSHEAMAAAMQRLQQEAMAGAAVKGEANATAGDAYREENGKKPGVVTRPSGLQYKVITEGAGPKPTKASTVTTHYAGTLIDGTKFDSSVDRGEPVSFPLNGVIKGWTEGLQHMKVGGKARLVIPPAIAYGPTGQGPIPPNSTLVFDVELLEIVKQ